MKEANLLCLQASNASPFAGTPDITDNTSIRTELLHTPLMRRVGYQGPTTRQCFYGRNDFGEGYDQVYIVIDFQALVLETGLTNHSRPSSRVDDGQIAPASLDLACIIAHIA